MKVEKEYIPDKQMERRIYTIGENSVEMYGNLTLDIGEHEVVWRTWAIEGPRNEFTEMVQCISQGNRLWSAKARELIDEAHVESAKTEAALKAKEAAVSKLKRDRSIALAGVFFAFPAWFPYIAGLYREAPWAFAVLALAALYVFDLRLSWRVIRGRV